MVRLLTLSVMVIALSAIESVATDCSRYRPVVYAEYDTSVCISCPVNNATTIQWSFKSFKDNIVRNVIIPSVVSPSLPWVKYRNKFEVGSTVHELIINYFADADIGTYACSIDTREISTNTVRVYGLRSIGIVYMPAPITCDVSPDTIKWYIAPINTSIYDTDRWIHVQNNDIRPDVQISRVQLSFTWAYANTSVMCRAYANNNADQLLRVLHVDAIWATNKCVHSNPPYCVNGTCVYHSDRTTTCVCQSIRYGGARCDMDFVASYIIGSICVLVFVSLLVGGCIRAYK